MTQGPLINEEAVEKVEAHVADALNKGAKVTIGGKRHALGRTFFEPTVLIGPRRIDADRRAKRRSARSLRCSGSRTRRMRSPRPTTRNLGLAAYFYARDLGRVWPPYEALEYGMVGINSGDDLDELAPFGGVKESGIGREGSRHGAEEFVEYKYMLMSGLDR